MSEGWRQAGILDESEIQDAIHREMAGADQRYGVFKSTHEGLGVLIEEMDELRTAIQGNVMPTVQKEAIQVAAVAWRLALSLINSETCDRSHP